MNIYNFLQLERAPKLDLHVHLQGSGNLHVMNYLINKNKLTVRAQILHDKKLNIRIQQYSELMSVLLAEKTTISDITSLFDYRITDQFFTTYKFLNLFINSISDLDLYIKGVVIKLIKQTLLQTLGWHSRKQKGIRCEISNIWRNLRRPIRTGNLCRRCLHKFHGHIMLQFWIR